MTAPQDVPGSVDAADYANLIERNGNRLDQIAAAEERAKKAKPAKPNSKAKEIEIWKPNVISAADLMASPPAPVRYVIPRFIPPGLTVIGGRPKCGKSLLAAQCSMTKAAGIHLWGHEVERGGVLYIDLENSRRRIYDRYIRMHEGNSQVPNLGWILEWPRGNRNAFTTLLDSRPDVQLVVIDIWKKFCAPQPRNLEQYDFETDELQWLAHEANERGIAIMLVLHTVKSPPLDGDPFSAIGGSSAVTGNADQLFVLRREGDVTKLYQRGRDSGDACHVLRLGDDLRFRYVCDSDRIASDDQMRYLCAIHDGHRMPTELMAALGFSRQAVWQMIRRLQAGGYVTLPGGIPSLTPMARQMVEALNESL